MSEHLENQKDGKTREAPTNETAATDLSWLYALVGEDEVPDPACFCSEVREGAKRRAYW